MFVLISASLFYLLSIRMIVVLLDDDTELENDFFIRHDLLEDPCVGGYCVGIAINRSPQFNIWEVVRTSVVKTFCSNLNMMKTT